MIFGGAWGGAALAKIAGGETCRRDVDRRRRGVRLTACVGGLGGASALPKIDTNNIDGTIWDILVYVP